MKPDHAPGELLDDEHDNVSVLQRRLERARRRLPAIPCAAAAGRT